MTQALSRRRSAALIFFASACALMFEVAIARVCSVVLPYHARFLVVSGAVLGIGIGGFIAHVASREGRATSRTRSASVALLCMSPAFLLSLAVLFLSAGDSTVRLVILVLVVMPAFVAAGALQSLLLFDRADDAHVIYAADLVGGAVGALASVVALDVLGGPVHALLILAVVAAAVAWAFARSEGVRVAGPALATVSVLALVANAAGLIDVDYGRTPQKLIHEMMEPEQTGTPKLLPELAVWDATSRVDVLALDGAPERHIFIDGETPTRELQAGAAAPALAAELPGLPYRVLHPRDVLVVGPGGGYDVALALEAGAARVEAVELNGGVLRVAAADRAYNGDVYALPGVGVHHAEGRRFVREAEPASFDLVTLTLAQSLVGNLREYALSENYLYTTEALADDLRVLRPGGVLAFTVSNAAVAANLVATAKEVLASRGVHSAVATAAIASSREDAYGFLVLVRDGPFPDDVIAAIEADARAHGYRALNAAPDRPRAATDDCPFFFYVPGALATTFGPLIGVALALLALSLAALALIARGRRASALSLGGCFAAFGAASMIAEVLVLQKTLLIVGFPTLNLGLVLGAFLLSAGCGSAASRRLLSSVARLRVALVAIGVGLLTIVPLLELADQELVGASLAVRCVVVVAALFPYGFAIGLPFPAALRLMPRADGALVPWLFGVNGVASVFGSTVAVALVLEAGLRTTALLPAALYLVAVPLTWALSRGRPTVAV